MWGPERRDPREPRLVRAEGSHRWTAGDWLLVLAAVGLGVAAAAAIMFRHPHPAR
jgi:hypothetical protein